MKKISLIFVVIFFAFVVTSCNNKTKDTPEIIIGSSDVFTEKEISDAMDCVAKNFNFTNTVLQKIYYDEEWSRKFLEGAYIPDGTSEENVIVISTEFFVDGSGDNPVLTPNMLYENYSWILIRKDKNSNWEIFDQGY